MPEIVQRCIDSQKALGYEFKLITLENCYRGSRYVQECIAAKKWVKASDFLRMHYLFTEGGIYLDADIEMKKAMDHLLDTDMFVCEEKNGVFANSVVGSVAGHPILKEYLRRVEENFRGDGDLTFEPGLRAFADLVWRDGAMLNVKILTSDFFFPFNHETQETKETENTLGHHYFLKSWVV